MIFYSFITLLIIILGGIGGMEGFGESFFGN
jgi:hypothetical protein